MFRCFSIKVWKGTEFNGNKHTAYNRIVNQHCINYYCKCWKDRKGKLHDESVQRKIIVDCQQKDHERALEGQNFQVRKFAITKIGCIKLRNRAHQKMDL